MPAFSTILFIGIIRSFAIFIESAEKSDNILQLKNADVENI